NPAAVLIFVADHISIPADPRRMDLTDKERYERIRETLGQYCAIVELARVEESEAVRWIGEYGATRDVKVDADAARELVDALGGDIMMVSNELEKLILYVGEKKRITLGDVETMVLAAKQRSLYELTDAISSEDRVRALEMLDSILTTGEGDEAAIGHLSILAKTFCQRRSLHVDQHFSADAGDPGAHRGGPTQVVVRTVAGLLSPSVCRR